MVRIIKVVFLHDDSIGPAKYIEAYGLSTDRKPVSAIATGSKYTAVDTGDKYLFDEENQVWYKDA